MKLKIAIYADLASKASAFPIDDETRKRFSEHKYSVSRVDRHDLADPAFYDDLYLLIIPGIEGETSFYHEHIGPSNPLIREWLTRGGKLLCFCAGANHAGSLTLWNPDWAKPRSRTLNEGLLAVFNGTTQGPVEGLGVDGEDPTHWRGLTSTIITIVGESDFRKSVRLIYSSGPAFIPHADVNVHGVYEEHPEKPAAIISFSYGKGFAVLSGPLPQYGVIQVSHDPKYQKLHELFEKISPYEQDREWVLDYLFNLIRNSDVSNSPNHFMGEHHARLS